MRQLIAILAATILAGCASNIPEQKPQPLVSSIGNDKPARVSRELSLAWDNIGQSGAALLQPSYIHVLGDGHVSATMNKIKEGNNNDANKISAAIKLIDINKAINAFKSMNREKGYSLYELSRWERYCNRGKGMDEQDWQFIGVESEINTPKDVITDCIPPAYTYQDYLNAWVHFCTNQTVTNADRRIIHNSVRPYSIVNQCNALNKKLN